MCLAHGFEALQPRGMCVRLHRGGARECEQIITRWTRSTPPLNWLKRGNEALKEKLEFPAFNTWAMSPLPATVLPRGPTLRLCAGYVPVGVRLSGAVDSGLCHAGKTPARLYQKGHP
ncbi:hypothetical protein NDU88_000400 [Pleurodeles waltl]|uniref:Uncharacterized protein n=1 Tax=Pleurodeles waltl TaxID=8319 RepID=A0AAV7LUQ5_PLEWA|nr:hypothetical protein NDU88_000400 [Pleurodeles waltl]